jgi:protein-S-isoprenylcysteine O-methyltransferase Ste14
MIPVKSRVSYSYLLLASIWAALLWSGHQWAAVGFLIASTLAYVGFVGIALWAEDNANWFTRRWGSDEGFRRFRRPAAIIMNNYGVSLVLLAVVTRGSMPWRVDDWVYWAVGGVLASVGYGIKLWAKRTIGEGYYWIDFFAPPEDIEHSAEGPYRWFSNPMYTIGYAHAYGFAIAMQSLHALLAAAFMQLSILGLWWFIERAHYEQVYSVDLQIQQEPSA